MVLPMVENQEETREPVLGRGNASNNSLDL